MAGVLAIVVGIVAKIHTRLGDLPAVTCSAGDLNQVFLNLVLNAVDAVADTPDPAITVSSRREGDDVVIEFSDNGSGIPDSLTTTAAKQ